MDNELNRVGVEIRLQGTWRETVSHYARRRNLHGPCLAMFDELIAHGHDEPWAALETLSSHGCTDLILGSQHVELRNMQNVN